VNVQHVVDVIVDGKIDEADEENGRRYVQ